MKKSGFIPNAITYDHLLLKAPDNETVRVIFEEMEAAGIKSI